MQQLVNSTRFAGNDEASTLLPTILTSPDETSLDVSNNYTSFTTRNIVTTTEKIFTTEDVIITSAGYTSTLGKKI